VSESASRQVSKSAKRPQNDALGPLFGRNTDFSGDFPGSILTMRENLGSKGFQQALIPNGLKIICKVHWRIYTPGGYTGG